jgi:predicted metalloprotease
MKWQGRQVSRNVSDRRLSGGTAIGGVGVIVLLIYTLISGDPSALIGSIINSSGSTNTELTAEEIQMGEFASVVLNDTEVIWTQIFEDYDMTYQPAQLVLYKDSTDTGCGFASSSVGPFYCSQDQTVYIDLVFYTQLKTQFNAPGDFAMAYVIAHEIGHHIQYLTGILDEYNSLRSELSTIEFNKLTVRLELQADYLAGVWAKHVQGLGYLEEGDLEEALNAASAVGDDRIQQESTGRVTPDNFTHGTSAQRRNWFYKGFTNGNLDEWDTFSAEVLVHLIYTFA